MEVLMDFLYITLTTIALITIFIMPTVVKRIYIKKRHEKLMEEYYNICIKSYEYTIHTQNKQPNNVISLEDYKDRVKNKSYEELL